MPDLRYIFMALLSKRIRRVLRLRTIHKYVGLFCFSLLILISITGWMLNHTDFLKLNNRYVSNSAVLAFYGIEKPEYEAAFRIQTENTNERWISQWSHDVYLDEELLVSQVGSVIGAVPLFSGELFAIVFSDSLSLYSIEGERIEKIDASSQFQGAISNTGLNKEGNLVVLVAAAVWHADEELLQWEIGEKNDADWVASDTLPDSLNSSLQEKAVSRIMSQEQFVLDLHSGRLFGKGGVLFYDIVAFGCILLSITGLIMWLKTRL